MDRAELSGAIKQELGALLTAALTAAAPTLATADLDGIERCVQAVGRQGLGRVVEQVVAARAAAAGGPPACAGCGGPTRCGGRARPRRLQGLVGDYTLRRPYYTCPACHAGGAPLDAALGLGAGALSPGLGRVACRLGIEGSFGAAADQLAETLGVTVAAEAVRRVTEGVGAVAEAEQQAQIARVQRGQAPAPAPGAGDGARPLLLVVEVDGVQAPLLDGWHALKVGRVGPLGPALQVDRASGRAHLARGPSGYGAGLEPAEACWARTHVEACRQGLGAGVQTVVALGDGAEWIWAHARRFLGVGPTEVVEVVDIDHAYAHLWAVGQAVFGADGPAAAAWVEPLTDRLYAEGAPAALAALAALAPPDAGAAEAVRLALGYFTTHATRMDDPRFVARHLPIGSGAVESACTALVEQRAKQAGMRWSRAGVQAVVSLRALHRSGRWADFWRTHPQRRRPPVAPRPPAPAAPPAPAPPPGAPPPDARLAGLPDGRTSAAPPVRPPHPVPAPLHPPARPWPAASHPWRRPLLPRRRSA
jgi:hypothetical protein